MTLARLRLARSVGLWRSGSGGRALRHWHAELLCSETLRQQPDGRWRCGECGRWFSASHSDCWLATIAGDDAVGVDVQVARRRPAALGVLARSAGLAATDLRHWALAEAVLKAVGRAQRPPTEGELSLPTSVRTAGWVRQPQGELLAYRVEEDAGTVLAVAVLVQAGDRPSP